MCHFLLSAAYDQTMHWLPLWNWYDPVLPRLKITQTREINGPFGESPVAITSLKRNIKCWLVVLNILKHMKVNGKDYPIYEMENKKMFQTTNQKWITKYPLAT